MLEPRPAPSVDGARDRGCLGLAVFDLARRIVAAGPQLDGFYVMRQPIVLFGEVRRRPDYCLRSLVAGRVQVDTVH